MAAAQWILDHKYVRATQKDKKEIKKSPQLPFKACNFFHNVKAYVDKINIDDISNLIETSI